MGMFGEFRSLPVKNKYSTCLKIIDSVPGLKLRLLKGVDRVMDGLELVLLGDLIHYDLHLSTGKII